VDAATRTDLEEARALFGNCVLFRGFGDAEKRALVTRAHMRKVPTGETIFLMGSQHDSMVAVLSGSVKISVPRPDGREIVLAILQPGEVFGEIAMLDGKERSADAIAMTHCKLAVLQRRDVLAFIDGNQGAWQRLVEVLCARMRRTDEHLVEVALLQLPARLAKALLRATEPDGQLAAAKYVALSQRELANLVGATRERVNKSLQQMRRAGIVRIDKAGLTIANRDALEDLAEQE
jgi:CRP/FNR family cyclic AMP-dependent transcriptional regulator